MAIWTLLALTGLVSFQFIAYLLQPRVEYSDSVLAGMEGFTAQVSSVGATLSNLERIPAWEREVFNCNHAIYAGAGRIYRSANHDYVNWGPNLSDPNQKSQGTFYCNVKSYDMERNQIPTSPLNFEVKMPDGNWNVYIQK
jgi:hypothetical protein